MGLSLRDELIAEAIPRKTALDRSELPPYDTNGNGTPTMGKSPIFMPIFTKHWTKSKEKVAIRKIFSEIVSAARDAL